MGAFQNMPEAKEGPQKVASDGGSVSVAGAIVLRLEALLCDLSCYAIKRSRVHIADCRICCCSNLFRISGCVSGDLWKAS
jgi:hypothetical protein